MSKSGEELWGLVERNKERLGITQIDKDPAFMSDEGIFLGTTELNESKKSNK